MAEPDSFLENLRVKLRPIMNRPAILDVELAELLGVQLKRIRMMVVRHRPHLSEEEAFHPVSGAAGSWAVTEVGALFLVSRMRTTLAAGISVQIVRDVVGAAEPMEVLGGFVGEDER